MSNTDAFWFEHENTGKILSVGEEVPFIYRILTPIPYGPHFEVGYVYLSPFGSLLGWYVFYQEFHKELKTNQIGRIPVSIMSEDLSSKLFYVEDFSLWYVASSNGVFKTKNLSEAVSRCSKWKGLKVLNNQLTS